MDACTYARSLNSQFQPDLEVLYVEYHSINHRSPWLLYLEIHYYFHATDPPANSSRHPIYILMCLNPLLNPNTRVGMDSGRHLKPSSGAPQVKHIVLGSVS